MGLLNFLEIASMCSMRESFKSSTTPRCVIVLEKGTRAPSGKLTEGRPALNKLLIIFVERNRLALVLPILSLRKKQIA